MSVAFLRGDYGVVEITRANGDVYEVLVDVEDLERLDEHNWSINHLGSVTYAATKTTKAANRRSILMHRLIMADALDDVNCVVDHLNHDGLDNRKRNLRAVPPAGNSQNQRLFRNNTSGLPGVTRHKGKWQVQVKRTYYGRYDTLEEARAVLERARAELMPFTPPLSMIA